MTPTRRLLASFSWVVVANLSRQFAFLVVNLLLYERLSRQGFGALSLAFGYMQVFAGLGEFGIRQIGWREVARQPESAVELTGAFLTAKIVTGIVATSLYLLLMPALWSDSSSRWIYILFGLGILFNGSAFDFPFYGLQRIDVVARLSFVAFSLYLVGCLALVRDDSSSWMVPALLTSSMALLLGLQIAWFFRRVGRFRLGIGLDRFRVILGLSWWLGVGETLNRLALAYPILLIGMVLGSEGVGNYRVAELAYSFLAQFGHIFASAVFSHISHVFHHQRPRLPGLLTRMLLLAVAGALVFGALVIALAPFGFRLAFANVSPETLAVLRLLGLALLFAGPVRFLKGLLASVDQQGKVILVNAASLALGSGIGWSLIGTHGIAGMAAAVAAAEAGTLAILLMIYRRTLRQK